MTQTQTKKMTAVTGDKGKSSSSSSSYTEEDNTLYSNSYARVVDLLCEGPINGLANGLQSVYFDETVVENEDETYNFDGFTITTRSGETDQDYLTGFPATETSYDVSTDVTYSNSITKTISDENADAVRIIISLASLYYSSDSSLESTSVQLKIEYQPDGGSWTTAVTDTISGKCTSTYERQYRIDLSGGTPYQIRVSRLTEDRDSATYSDTITWSSYTVIEDLKLSYPDSAVVGINIDASQFGTSIPTRYYEIEGRLIKIPSNYDPDARTYTGTWDGTFTTAYSNNPAWVFYDLLTNTRFGAGLDNIDTATLYTIGQYCDESVDDGDGGTEPRYTCNICISSQSEAYDVINTMASVFRGMVYWGYDSVISVQDSPSDPVALATNANVVDGNFKYVGTALDNRYSVALVKFQNPDDYCNDDYEVVEIPELVQKYGWKQTSVIAYGCTSRGLAHRIGKWALYSDEYETETVEFDVGTDFAMVRPGDIVSVMDKFYAGSRLGGRIATTGTSTLTLDALPDDFDDSDGWTISVVLPDLTIGESVVSSFSGLDITLVSELDSEPVAGAIWILTSSTVDKRNFRVLSATENTDDGTITISAVENNADKYDLIESDVNIVTDDDNYSFYSTGSLTAPSSVTAQSYTKTVSNILTQYILVSWDIVSDARISGYQVQVKVPDSSSWESVGETDSTSIDYKNSDSGDFSFRVRAYTSDNLYSSWVSASITISNNLLPGDVTNVSVVATNFTVTLTPTTGDDTYLYQSFQYYKSQASVTDPENDATYLGSGSTYTDTGLDYNTTYYYYVRAYNAYGTSDFYAVEVTTSEDVSEILEALTDKITEEQLYSDLTDKIDAIDDIQVDVDTINDNLDDLSSRYDASELSLTRTNASLGSQSINNIAQIRNTNVLISTESQSTAASISELSADLDEQNSDLTTISSATVGYCSIDGIFNKSQCEAAGGTWHDGAQAQQITQLQSNVDTNSALITTEATTRADADSALAETVSTLSTTVGDNTTSIQTVSETVDGVTAEKFVKIDNNGRVTGYGIYASQTSTTFAIVADEFYIADPDSTDTGVAPFIVSDGTVYIDSAFIEDLTVSRIKILNDLTELATASSTTFEWLVSSEQTTLHEAQVISFSVTFDEACYATIQCDFSVQCRDVTSGSTTYSAYYGDYQLRFIVSSSTIGTLSGHAHKYITSYSGSFDRYFEAGTYTITANGSLFFSNTSQSLMGIGDCDVTVIQRYR